MFDFIYEWAIHIVPKWLWWVLMAPLFTFLIIILVAHFWPRISGG